MAALTSLSAVDAAWLHMDRPENTADVVALLEFSDRLPLEALHRLLEERLLSHARFRERIVPTGLPGGARWEVDPEFSLSHHVLHQRLRKQGRKALEEFVGQVATEPLDLRHSPWRQYLVEGFGRGSAIVGKLHHCMGDGFALVGLLLALADEQFTEGAGAPPHRQPSFRELSFRDWSHVPALAAQGGAFALSLAHMATLPSDPETVLKQPLSGRRHAAWSGRMSLHRVRVAAHRQGATVNDLLMAALAGALRSELAASGEPVDEIRVRALVPINLRPPGQPIRELGNRFGLVFLELPIDRPTPEERLETIQTTMRVLKGTPDAVVTFAVLGAMGMLPTRGERLIADFFTQKASLVATNVPGPREHLHLAGHRLAHMMFWVPHPAVLGLGVSILSYAGEVRIGVRADEAVLPRPADLVARFEQELALLLELPAAIVSRPGRAKGLIPRAGPERSESRFSPPTPAPP